MIAIVFPAQAAADAYSAAIDAKLGYPKLGSPVGGGPHRSGGGITARHNLVIKHPTLAQWAYPRDATETAQAVALPGGAVAQALDATWTPVVVIGTAEVL